MSNATTVTFTTVQTTTWTAPALVTNVTYLVVGGGGGGGGGYDYGMGGGGGGGMVQTGILTVIPGTTYNVTVGGGGSGAIPTETFDGTDATAGGNSIFASITALGGSRGLGSRQNNGTRGAGGAAANNGTNTASVGGSGGGYQDGGGGGGGSSGNGTNGTTGGAGGSGGAGTTSSLSGSSVTYGTGGDGADHNSLVNGKVDGASASANTGDGGDGATSDSNTNGDSNNVAIGGAGGSGIVILQYTPDPADSVVCILKGTRILTDKGYKPVEDVNPDGGDLLVTHKGSYLKSIKMKMNVLADHYSAPYRIPKGFFGKLGPNRDIFLSPRHAILLSNNVVVYPVKCAELKQHYLGEKVDYYHFETPDYTNDSIVCEGLPIETFENK